VPVYTVASVRQLNVTATVQEERKFGCHVGLRRTIIRKTSVKSSRRTLWVTMYRKRSL